MRGKIESMRSHLGGCGYGIDEKTREGRLVLRVTVEVTEGPSEMLLDFSMGDVGRLMGSLDEVMATHRDLSG